MAYRGRFFAVVGLIQIVFIVIFAFFMEYDADADATNPKHNNDPDKGGQDPKDNSLGYHYSMFQDIHAMIFFGIGYLYTFLQKYGYTGVGMNMLLAYVAIQWAMITQNCWNMQNGKIRLSIMKLIMGDFASASALIAFGGIFGKVSPLQMIVFTICEIAIYTTNEHLCIKTFQVADLGGSVSLHLFAALFGLSVAFVVDRKKAVQGNPNESTNYVSNMFCMLGTVFLWAFWPSFNSALAVGESQHRSAINTFLALLGSCVTAFVTSSFLNKDQKFTMTHIQNATLAGGVAIGTAADMMIEPAGALAIGSIAGCISVAGYTYVSPFLAKLNVYDPCGINSLHAIPGMLAGIIGAITALLATEKSYGYVLYRLFPAMAPGANTTALMDIQSHLSDIGAGEDRTPLSQAGYQLVYMVVTMAVGIVSGLITGLILRVPFFEPLEKEKMYIDDVFWDMPEVSREQQNNINHINTTKF